MKNFIRMSFLFYLLLIFNAKTYSQVEIREYEGQKLSPFNREYDNSIKGPQAVDVSKYKLTVSGKSQKALSMTYNQILALPSVTRVITLHCVEGWDETLLFKGVRLADIIKNAIPNTEVQTIIFFAEDGYSSSLTYKYVIENDIMLAYEINGIRLDAVRGFPLQVVAESKYGYKWVKWVAHIELYDKPYLGYWEQLGYDNEAGVSN